MTPKQAPGQAAAAAMREHKREAARQQRATQRLRQAEAAFWARQAGEAERMQADLRAEYRAGIHRGQS